MMEIEPIGLIHSPFSQASGTPIQSSLAQGAEGVVEVFPRYAEALKDVDGFERIWLLYWFHKATQTQLIVRPYMDNAERGLFATRAPCRPNPIGISSVRLLQVQGCNLHIADLDILDETPLLDIKPYAPMFDCFDVSRTGWLQEVTVGQTLADGRFSQNQDK